MQAPNLVLVAQPALAADEMEKLRRLSAEGATIIAWQHSAIVQDRFPSPNVAMALRRAEIPCVTLGESLGPLEDADVEEAVIRWMKAFGRARLGTGGSFRDQFRYGPLVLWWWAELYLYHETPLRLLIRDVEALARLVEKTRPTQIHLFRPPRRLEAAARSLVSQVVVVGSQETGPPSWWRTTALHASDFLKMMGTGLKSLLRRRHQPVEAGPGHPRVFFLTHASMWRSKKAVGSDLDELAEMYFDSMLPAVSRRAAAIVVAFGPAVPFKQRKLGPRIRDLLELADDRRPYRSIRNYFPFSLTLRVARGFFASHGFWRRFRQQEELEHALSHRGVFLGSEALASFRDTFLRQIPWSIRAYHEVESVLAVERPDVLVLYAESSGRGRAAVLAARQSGIPSFAVQHGIMYPQYYSHEHEPEELEREDEGEAVPIPSCTAVFGSLAKDLLVDRGGYPEDRILVTGSPKFDALVEAAAGYDAAEARRIVGVPEGAQFLVLASRFSAVGPVFEELVEAVEHLDDLWLLVKPHQAESPTPYVEVLSRLSPSRSRLVDPSMNLLELLFASDGLITVDSFASSEALVLGRPVVVVNLPSNLASLVDRGVALGVARGASIEAALRRLFFEDRLARQLEEKRKVYLREFAFGADGRSTERIVGAILETAVARSR